MYVYTHIERNTYYIRNIPYTFAKTRCHYTCLPAVIAPASIPCAKHKHRNHHNILLIAK